MRTQKHWRFNSGIHIVAAILILFSNFGCRQSTPIPAEIVGDSMAPGLCGKCILQTCPECSFQFKTSNADCPESILCPNCVAKFPPSTRRLPADTVDVIPNQTLKRWDVVAIQQQENTLTKRIVGLPGETIELIAGDLYVDGNLASKPEVVTEQLKTFVFDSHFRRPSFSPLEFDAEHWTRIENELKHVPHDSESVDFIRFRRPTVRSAKNENRERWPVIDDSDSFNQNVSRNLHVVEDLIVETDLTLTDGSEFVMRRLIGNVTYTASISFQSQPPQITGSLSDGSDNQSFAVPIKPTTDDGQRFRLKFANIDGTISLTANDIAMTTFTTGVSQSTAKSRETTQPVLQFGFRGSSSGSVKRCRIWRDIYYYAEDGLPKFRLPSLLGDDEYFVLGDNVPVSRDSRHFGPVKKIIGVVEK